MTNVFIDTNILLNFFSYSTDHLNKLEEFVALIKAGKIRLFVPQQVVDEFNRNREVKLKEVLKNLNSFATDLKSPVVCHDLDEMKKIQTLLTELSDLRKKLIESVTTQIKARSLKADMLIDEIFSIGKPFPIGEPTLAKAKMRFDLGNPPGKDDSYGDAVNWEALLESVPTSEDLVFIGRDKDYVSAIDSSDFSSFLKDEWRMKKKSEIHYYDLLSKFLKDKFAETKITDAEVKEEKTAAEQFPSGSVSGSAVSRSFRLTPEIVSKLTGFSNEMAALRENPHFQRGVEEIMKDIEERAAFVRSHPEMVKRVLEVQDEIRERADYLRKHPEIFEQLTEVQKRMPDIVKQMEELNKMLGK